MIEYERLEGYLIFKYQGLLLICHFVKIHSQMNFLLLTSVFEAIEKQLYTSEMCFFTMYFNA